MDNVVVTGASRGLGLAIAERLAADGFRVIAVARKSGEALEAAQQKAGDAIVFRACDLGEIDTLADFARGLRSEFGPLYGLVNNAGISIEGLLANLRDSEIERIVRLNTLSPMLLSKYVARSMMALGRGRIVNMSSIVASTGFNGLSVYAATKATMIGFTKSLAREIGRVGITVNAIAPGFIDTELTAGLEGEGREKIVGRSALRRLAEPTDVAAMTAFLLGEGGRNITGTVLTVDAGGTA